MTREEAREEMIAEWEEFISGSGLTGHEEEEADKNSDFKQVYEANMMAIKALEQEPCDDTGEISDGYHTFNQLYHQRAILFASIVNQNADIAWKSYKHSDGKYCFDSDGEWFIVGVDTPEGSYTYHYSKEYWNYFKCKELDCGKEWDGHTEEDVTRLLSLKQEPCEDAISRQAAIDVIERWLKCSDYNEAERHIMRAMQSILYDLPSVTPAEKVGHWIKLDDCANSGYYCSDCHKRVVKEGWSDTVKIIKYCPNCGTKMEEV